MNYKDFIPLIKELADESPAVERCGVIHADELLTFDNTADGLDVAIDLTDVDVAAIQATLSGGMLAAYQRARTMGAWT